MRKGFGMIQVILFMVILSTILTIVMKYASISIKQTKDLYLKERAELFMQSAIEIALFGISTYDRSTNSDCLNEIHIVSSDKRFFVDINITNYYLFQMEGCDREKIIQTEESTGMVMMDIVLETNNTHPKNTHPIRLTRHTMQRP